MIMDEELLGLAKKLVKSLQKNDQASTEELLEKMVNVRETHLFQEVGRLTRQLHDTLVSFTIDNRINELAEHEIPDARDRLNYVITMTQQSADQTLTAIETLLPVSDELGGQSKELSEKWNRFLTRQMPYEEFKVLARDLSAHFEKSDESIKLIQSGLNDILMAQSFQDITGQIIRRVIDLVQEMEVSMVDIIQIASRKNEIRHIQQPELPGPVVPGVDDRQGCVAHSQVDVDDLLSSLGF